MLQAEDLLICLHNLALPHLPSPCLVLAASTARVLRIPIIVPNLPPSVGPMYLPLFLQLLQAGRGVDGSYRIYPPLSRGILSPLAFPPWRSPGARKPTPYSWIRMCQPSHSAGRGEGHSRSITRTGPAQASEMAKARKTIPNPTLSSLWSLLQGPAKHLSAACFPGV